jgi:hypothetical protein
MKITPDAGSPWGRKVRFDEREFDDIMDEVRSRGGGSAFVPGTGVDVDAVLRDAFEVEPDFVDLTIARWEKATGRKAERA